MKATEKPQFSKRWWSSQRPADIKGTELEKALASVEKMLAEEKKQSDEKSVSACITALETLETAVEKTIDKECDKKKHKDVITVLGRFGDMIKDEFERLEQAQESANGAKGKGDDEDEEDEDEGKLFDKDYLYKMVKLLYSSGKELNFGFGLNTNAPESSQLLLKRKGKPELLFKALKKTGNYSNRTLVCGRALADPDNGKVLMLRVEEGDEPPQILKLGRKFLRADKSLRFRKLKVVIGGKTLEDNEPDTDDEGNSGGDGIPPEEMVKIKEELANMAKRLAELMREHTVGV